MYNNQQFFSLNKLNTIRILSFLTAIVFIQIPFTFPNDLAPWLKNYEGIKKSLPFLYISIAVLSFFIRFVKRNYSTIYLILGTVLFAFLTINVYQQDFEPSIALIGMLAISGYGFGFQRKRHLVFHYLYGFSLLFLCFQLHPDPVIEGVRYSISSCVSMFMIYLLVLGQLNVEKRSAIQKIFINTIFKNTSNRLCLLDLKTWSLIDHVGNQLDLSSDIKKNKYLEEHLQIIYLDTINFVKNQLVIIKGEVKESGEFKSQRKVVTGQESTLSYHIDVLDFEKDKYILKISTSDEKQQKIDQEALKMIHFTLENVSDILFWLNKKNQIIYANRVAVRRLGYQFKKSQQIKMTDIDETYQDVWSKIKGNGDNRAIESTYRTKNRERFPVEVTYSKFKFNQKEYICAFVKDITNRKTREQIFKKIVEHSPMGIFTTDQEGKIMHTNETFETLLGYTKQQLKGLSLEKLFPLEHKSIDYKKIHKKQVREEVFQAINGEKICFNITSSPWSENKSLNNRHLLNIAEDIRYRKQAEEDRKIHTQKLETSNKDLEQFAYVVSHDLQEPLRMITGYLGIIEKRYKEEANLEVLDLLSFSIDGAKRMNILIQDLLEYSRINTKGRPFTLTDSNEMIINVLIVLQRVIEESQAQVTYKNLPTIKGDQGQLSQLFQNLIENAIKYRSDNPLQIDISAKKGDHEWVFAIRDNGIGIEEEYQKQIFGVFERLHTRQEYPGTGIGLAICHRIVLRHNGKIWVKSTPGQGSCFYFSIPIQQEEV